MIWGSPPRDKPYNSSEYDPFWAAAQQLDLPLSLHIITGKNQGKGRGRRNTGEGDEAETARTDSAPSEFLLASMGAIHSIQRTLQQMTFAAGFHRFPLLKI